MSLELLSYSHDDVALAGHLAVPAGPARGGVVIFPNIANTGERFERAAQDFADLGYVALVADLYGFVPEGFDASFAFGIPLKENTDLYRARCLAAVQALKARPEAAGLKIAATGYCMGGTAALELARAGTDLVAAVSYHGGLGTEKPAAPGGIKARILVCNGDADPSVTRDVVVKFWEEMDAAGAKWHFHQYAGAKHGFTEEESDHRGRPEFLAYDASADRQSWAATVAFFDEVFGG